MFFDLSRVDTFASWVVAFWALVDVAQLRDWLHEGLKPREMRAMRQDWSLSSIVGVRPTCPDR